MVRKYIEDISLIKNDDFLITNVGMNIQGNDEGIEFYDKKTHEWFFHFDNKIKLVEFDSVKVSASHSFGGTSYHLFFYLNDKYCITGDPISFVEYLDEFNKEQLEKYYFNKEYFERYYGIKINYFKKEFVFDKDGYVNGINVMIQPEVKIEYINIEIKKNE